jgi:hypothetical protein
VNGGTGNPAASVITSEWTPSLDVPDVAASDSPIAVAICATVSATIDRIHLTAAAGRAEHHLDDVADVRFHEARDERDAARRNARERGDGFGLDENRALGRLERAGAGARGQTRQRRKRTGRSGEHLVGQRLQGLFLHQGYSSSSTIDAICTATRSLLTPG